MVFLDGNVGLIEYEVLKLIIEHFQIINIELVRLSAKPLAIVIRFGKFISGNEIN
jgi:hypothetical protein